MIGESREQADDVAAAEIRVAVADERRLIAEALAALIGTMAGFSVTGVVEGDGAACAVGMQKPDILLVGMGPRPSAPFALVKSMRADVPEVQIVIVADAFDPGLVRFVVEQRVAGLLLSRTSTPAFASSLDQIVHGRAVMPMGWQGMLVDEQDDPLSCLSERQMEVLTLLAAGCS